MKIDELIEKLEMVKETYGDYDIKIYASEWAAYLDVKSLRVNNNSDYVVLSRYEKTEEDVKWYSKLNTDIID